MANAVSAVPKSVAILNKLLLNNIDNAQLQLLKADSNAKLIKAYLCYKSCQNAVAGVNKTIVDNMNKFIDAQVVYSASRAITNKALETEDSDDVKVIDPDVEDTINTINGFTDSTQRQKFAKKRCDYCVEALIPEVSALVSTLTDISSHFESEKQRKLVAIESKKKSFCKFCKNGKCRGSGKYYDFYIHNPQPASQQLLANDSSSSSVVESNVVNAGKGN